ncbi:MAG: Pvc16 family protein [Anaerolineae bacterium]
MLNDLDETLKQLLIQKAGFAPADMDIIFDIPTRDWATQAVTRPTVNLYLFDIRENLERREMAWAAEPSTGSAVRLKRRPVRIDLSYMITCWTTVTEDQHRLLWAVLATLFRHSPLPEDILQGSLKQLVHPVLTHVAQPDGVLKNVSDFWGALENQLRPAITLVVTLDLDLEEFVTAPLVFAKIVKVGEQAVAYDRQGRAHTRQALQPGWETLPIQVGGVVRDPTSKAPVAGATVRLVRGAGEREMQSGAAATTGEDGRYAFDVVAPGDYTLVIQRAAQGTTTRVPVTIAAPESCEAAPVLTREVEAPMP